MIEHAPWFTEARFGMFVHWGLYALPARHEWVMQRERRTPEEYERYARWFDPDLYDPRAWAAAARSAGMRYVVLTTKHHEGFCLWDSKLTEYSATHTPAGRDLIAEYVDAVRAEGLKVGFYHSLIDWHHPDFLVDGRHPQRDAPDAEALNEGRDMARYRAYLHGQVRELLTNYGTIDYLFFDFSYGPDHPNPVWGGKSRADWASEELLAMVRELQPGIVVNDRLDIPGDFITPEQYQPSRSLDVTWEACQTLNGSWGYDRDNDDYKSVPMLVRMLVDGVSKGGNLLLNVGPTGRGNLDPHAVETLAGIGEWMSLHARSVYGAGPAPYPAPPDARYTLRGNRLYLHLFAWPFKHVHLEGMADKVEYAQLLNDASEIGMEAAVAGQQAVNTTPRSQAPGTLTLTLPVRPPRGVAVPVVELFLRDA